jgi:hypothetical protein
MILVEQGNRGRLVQSDHARAGDVRGQLDAAVALAHHQVGEPDRWELGRWG